jgi:DnaK suppressor protein
VVKSRPAARKPVARTAPARPAPRPVRSVPAAITVKPANPVPQVADEADGEPRFSLLAGPRNVKPYVARKDEEYMSKEQLDHFRRILASWKQDLMQEVDRTMLHMKDEAANFPDPNDRATQESEFSLELRTRDRERKLIRKIDEALKRIEDGSYGYCLETGEPIGVKRLEARPVATLSVEAQERRERREKQFGDRDDWYR